MDPTTVLDRYIPQSIREEIEKRYYSEICRKSALDACFQDDAFLERLPEHIALYSDHGVVHARDVAKQIITVLENINGVLIPKVSTTRLSFMQSYGVCLAYLHDIGMVNFTDFGRVTHAEYASHKIFDPEFDEMIETLWEENFGNISWRLTKLAKLEQLKKDPKIILREMLSCSVAHSRTVIDKRVLGDPHQLRLKMQHIIASSMELLYADNQVTKRQKQLAAAERSDKPMHSYITALSDAKAAQKQTEDVDNGNRSVNIDRFYDDFENESYLWLISDHQETQELAADVISTLRALRTADCLRQRGSTIKTSAGYQIFLNRATGLAIFALQSDKRDATYLLEVDYAVSAGEANIATCELTMKGTLRIAFRQGAFSTPEALAIAVYSTAYILNDIQEDLIGSFWRLPEEEERLRGKIKLADEIEVLIEEHDENHQFALLVSEELRKITDNNNLKIQLEPSLQNVMELERNRYLFASELTWTESEKLEVLENIAKSGHKSETIDIHKAFIGVREIKLQAGEVLLEAKSHAGFCYIPINRGLMGVPLGGYGAFYAGPWSLIGATSVICGAMRNATIVAVSQVRLLMIPQEIYLKYWHYTYTPEEFRDKMRGLAL